MELNQQQKRRKVETTRLPLTGLLSPQTCRITRDACFVITEVVGPRVLRVAQNGFERGLLFVPALEPAPHEFANLVGHTICCDEVTTSMEDRATSSAPSPAFDRIAVDLQLIPNNDQFLSVVPGTRTRILPVRRVRDPMEINATHSGELTLISECTVVMPRVDSKGNLCGATLIVDGNDKIIDDFQFVTDEARTAASIMLAAPLRPFVWNETELIWTETTSGISVRVRSIGSIRSDFMMEPQMKIPYLPCLFAVKNTVKCTPAYDWVCSNGHTRTRAGLGGTCCSCGAETKSHARTNVRMHINGRPIQATARRAFCEHVLANPKHHRRFGSSDITFLGDCTTFVVRKSIRSSIPPLVVTKEARTPESQWLAEFEIVYAFM